MFKIIALAVLVAVTLSYNFPLYKQCDSKWGSEQLGTSANTICKAGCLMSSAAMALQGTGHSYDPHSLNQWLKGNGGYVSGDLFVWASINKLGLTFQGFISNSAIKSNLDQNRIVILNVHNGGHWVLATGYSGDSIKVNDPGYSTSTYSLSEIVNGNTGSYSVVKIPLFLNSWLCSAQQLINYVTGKEQDQPPTSIPHEAGHIRQE